MSISSARLGSDTPEGWLWAKIIAAALCADAAVRAQEGTPDLCDQLFQSIGVVAEALTELPVAARRMRRPMGELVERRGEILLGSTEQPRRWKMDLVVVGPIEGP